MPYCRFRPFQPGHEAGVDYFLESDENLFQDFIPLSFYQFQVSSHSNGWFSTIPDGCIDILICCSPEHSNTFVYGHLPKTKKIKVHTGADYFGIRLPYGLFFTLFQASAKEMQDEVYTLQEVSSSPPAIEEPLMRAVDFGERVHIAKKKLLPFLTCMEHPIIRHVLQTAYFTKGTIPVRALSKETGYSERYLRRLFSDHFGLSPKQFFEVVRFQHSLSLLKTYSVDDVLEENGYYDQSHMSNEFKKFGYITPMQSSQLFS
ncbi:helix-turn-helix transcriptional regulator [Salibacterium salarium]|nr:helix-turn-helix transcriptional regulator [Salibacterium salarium]